MSRQGRQASQKNFFSDGFDHFSDDIENLFQAFGNMFDGKHVRQTCAIFLKAFNNVDLIVSSISLNVFSFTSNAYREYQIN